MAYCFYNGVKLPELPSDVLATYPYCWIRKNDNTQHYDLIFTKVLGYYDATAGGIVYGENSATAEIAHYRVAYADASTADSWDSYQTTETWMALDANRTVMWSNHYIPNGSLTATEMYFDGSEAIPDAESYEIQKDTLVGIADQVRRLCNTEDIMTPAQMTSNLEGLNIELMETYVISTSTEQTIYPDEGYYGFSKVIVGAVDSGGDSGSGGTGGGDSGGDSDGGTDYPSAEDTTFGTEEGEGEIPTGMCLYYMTERDTTPTKAPALPAGGYGIMFAFNSGGVNTVEYYSSPIPWQKTGIYTILSGGEKIAAVYHYYPDEENQTWVHVRDDYANWSSLGLEWTSHNILKYGDGTIADYASPQPVPETTTGTGQIPVDREETYTVSGDTLNGLVGAAQTVTGAEEPMTLENATNALKVYSDNKWEGGSY